MNKLYNYLPHTIIVGSIAAAVFLEDPTVVLAGTTLLGVFTTLAHARTIDRLKDDLTNKELDNHELDHKLSKANIDIDNLRKSIASNESNKEVIESKPKTRAKKSTK